MDHTLSDINDEGLSFGGSLDLWIGRCNGTLCRPTQRYFLENTVELDDLTYHHDGRLRDRDYRQTKDIHRVYTTV